MKTLAILCLMFFANLSIAQDTSTNLLTLTKLKQDSKPTEVTGVKVIGNDSVIEIGELVKLSAELVNPPEGLKIVNYSWTVLPERDVVVWPDQTRIVFGTGAVNRTFTVVLTAAVLVGSTETPTLTTYTTVATVKVGGNLPNPPTPNPNPDPTPNPDPNPDPTPEPPSPGLTGLAKDAYDWLNVVQVSPTYTLETRNSDASLLADSFESIASSIAAGVYKDYNSILTATRNANRLAISSKNEWAPWFAKLASKLEASFSDGSIKTQDQVQLAWREIAYGLKKASK